MKLAVILLFADIQHQRQKALLIGTRDKAENKDFYLVA